MIRPGSGWCGKLLGPLVALVLLAVARGGWTKEPAHQKPPVVVASVAGMPIYAGEVTAELDPMLKRMNVGPSARPRLEAEMLELLIDRRLVVEYLESRHEAADPKQVDAELQKMRDLVRQHGSTIESHAAARGMTEAAVRSEINWRMSWKDYVERRVTDRVLEQYFLAHRRDYDGTEIRASQIFLAAPANADAAARQALLAKAAEIRGQIATGKLKFADAVARYSSAASKQSGGDLGFLQRHGSMPEAAATALFVLEKDQVSPPIVSSFGVHLLHVTEIKPGQKTWHDASAELKSAVIRQGFRRIVEVQRPLTAVEYTGAMSHLDPKTGALVVPPADH